MNEKQSTQPVQRSRYFDVFISYARRDANVVLENRTLNAVAAFKRELERHRYPIRPRRRFSVCTDVEDFELDETNSGHIRRRLVECGSMLLVCSSNAAISRFVRFEIDVFTSLHGGDRVCPAFLDVQPDTAFPELFESERMAVDLSPLRCRTIREYRQQLREQSHKLVAWAWDMQLVDIHNRFRYEQRVARRKWRLTLMATLVLFSSIVLSAGTSIGYHSVGSFVDDARIMNAGRAEFLDDTRFVSIKQDELLMWATNASQPTSRAKLGGFPRHVSVMECESVVVADRSTLLRIDLKSGIASSIFTAPADINGVQTHADQIAVLAEARLFVGNDVNGFVEAPRPVVEIGLQFPSALRERGPLRYGETLTWSPDGQWVASATQRGCLIVYNPSERRFLNARPVVYETENTRPIGAMAFELTGNRLIFAEGGQLKILDVQNMSVNGIPGGSALATIVDIAVCPDDQRLTCATPNTLEWFVRDGAAYKWQRRDAVQPGPIIAIAFSETGHKLLVIHLRQRIDLFEWSVRSFGVDIWK